MTVISHTRNFAFVHIPKCGGSSVEVGWSKHLRWGDFVIGGSDDGEIIQPVFNRLYKIAKHTTARQIAESIGPDTFANMRSMALVRPPLEVVESEYRYAIAQWRDTLRIERLRVGDDADAFWAFENRVMQEMASGFSDSVPKWWFQHNGGTIPAALLSETFEDFLERVADNRWRNYFGRYLTDAGGKVMVNDVIPLKDHKRIVDYFHTTIGLSGFELPWDNPGAPMTLTWPDDLRRTYLDLFSSDLELLGLEAVA